MEVEVDKEEAWCVLAITQSSRQIEGDVDMLSESFESTRPPPTILVHLAPSRSLDLLTSFTVLVLVPVPATVPVKT